MRVLGLKEEEGSSLEFLRRGYKVVLTLILWPFSCYLSFVLKYIFRMHTSFLSHAICGENWASFYRVPLGGKKMWTQNYLLHGVVERALSSEYKCNIYWYEMDHHFFITKNWPCLFFYIEFCGIMGRKWWYQFVHEKGKRNPVTRGITRNESR